MTVAPSFAAEVVEVHDGDTFKAVVDLGPGTTALDRDLGFHLYVERRRVRLHADVRLRGVNAIELADPGGAEARDYVASIMPVGTRVTLRTAAPDKYGGRYDADVTLPDGRDLAATVIAAGYAAAWDGAGAKPTPPWPRRDTVPR